MKNLFVTSKKAISIGLVFALMFSVLFITRISVEAAGVNTTLQAADGAVNKQWTITLVDGTASYIYEGGSTAIACKKYTIINDATGKALTWQGNGWDSLNIITDDFVSGNAKQIWLIGDALMAGGNGYLSTAGSGISTSGLAGAGLVTNGYATATQKFNYNTTSKVLTYVATGNVLRDDNTVLSQSLVVSSTQSYRNNQAWQFDRIGSLVTGNTTTDELYTIKNKGTGYYLTWTGSVLTTQPYNPGLAYQKFRLKYEASLSGYRLCDGTNVGYINNLLIYDSVNNIFKMMWNPGDTLPWSVATSLPWKGDFINKSASFESELVIGGKYVQSGANQAALQTDTVISEVELSGEDKQKWIVDFTGETATVASQTVEVVTLKNKSSQLYLTKSFTNSLLVTEKTNNPNQKWIMFNNGAWFLSAPDIIGRYVTIRNDGTVIVNAPDWGATNPVDPNVNFCKLTYTNPVTNGMETTIYVSGGSYLQSGATQIDNEAVDLVNTGIAGINLDTITANDSTTINAIKTSYDALNAAEKSLVSNYAKLTKALATLSPLSAYASIGAGETRIVTHGTNPLFGYTPNLGGLNYGIGYSTVGDTISIPNVDFGNAGAQSVTLSATTATAGQKYGVYIDNDFNTLIAEIALPDSNGSNLDFAYAQTVSVYINTAITGVHTVNIKWIDATASFFSLQFVEKAVNFKNLLLTGTTLTNIAPSASMTESGFIANIATGAATSLVFHNGVNGKVGTGVTMDVINGTTTTYTLLIFGDLTGDGDVGIADLASIKQHLLNVTLLTGTKLDAADIQNKGSVTVSDLLSIKKSILGIGTINQNRTA